VALSTNATKNITLKPGERGIGVAAGTYTSAAATTTATAQQIAVLVEPLTAARPTTS
jgi:hypothetical protein